MKTLLILIIPFVFSRCDKNTSIQEPAEYKEYKYYVSSDFSGFNEGDMLYREDGEFKLTSERVQYDTIYLVINVDSVLMIK